LPTRIGGIRIFRLRKAKKIQHEEIVEKTKKQAIPSQISACEELVKNIFQNSSDLVVQTFSTSKNTAMIVFIDGLVNKDLIDRDILSPIKSPTFNGDIPLALKSVFQETEDMSVLVESVLCGNAAVFYEHSKKAYLVEFKGWDKRNVTEPEAEAVIRGPKEGFTENIRTNTALIRRKIKTPKFVVENITLGRQTKTSVAVVYIKGIVNQGVLEELKRRLSKIDTDEILETGQIEQHICENTFSSVSGIGITQKPDVAAQRVLGGRIAVLCDGTPHALTIPELFIENLHTAEDYYNRTVYSSIVRILRGMALATTVLFPGLAVAIITYHAEMLPSVFLTSIISASQKTPMPIAAEVLLLTGMFELIREAGSRMPKAVGSAITIVGSLIIGEAAVSAGIISEPMVIVVALTAVTGFMTPNLLEFIVVYRAFFWLLGTFMGLIGISAGFFIMLTHLISTYTFGIPILSSFSKNELKDSFFRAPLRWLTHRPESIAKKNIRKQD
jgi:spore germination protein KA